MKHLRWYLKGPLLLLTLSLAIVLSLRWAPIRYTPLMLRRTLQYGSDTCFQPHLDWVPLDEISPDLIEAVLYSEDQRFYHHHGFDRQELETMWKAHLRDGTALRGCSTLSQQTAKNVFTFGTSTIFRKVSEAWWTILIELIWGKRRILEVYLNVAETGRGLFGVEAASRYYYGVPARQLDGKRATSLAVCFPKPLYVRPDSLGTIEKKRVRDILEHTLSNCY